MNPVLDERVPLPGEFWKSKSEVAVLEDERRADNRGSLRISFP